MPALRSQADRLLHLIKMRGPQTAADLGKALGTTSENARQQLVKLAADGLVEAESQAKGVGRPLQSWRLTERGHQRFPDTHAELTVSLLNNIRTVLGPRALDKIIAAREDEMRRSYRAELAPAPDTEARLSALARIRSLEGYMAEWRKAEDGDGWLFIENHCPICAAATVCQGFCRAELAIFRELLGSHCTVERSEHVIHGGRRCAYRIRPQG